MAGPTILITGATGFIGFEVLKKLVQQNFHIRVVVRSASKKTVVQDALRRHGLDESKLDYTEVPDMTEPGSFNDAVKGVSQILHIASPLPLPSEDPEATIVRPAVAVTMNLLTSAQQYGSETLNKVVR
jgi:nucleoside-diphosphate-sugar epimerase